MVQPRDNNVPGKIGEASPAGYTLGKGKRPRGRPLGPGGVITCPSLPVSPCFFRDSRSIRCCWKPWGISRHHGAGDLTTIPRGKADVEMNELTVQVVSIAKDLQKDHFQLVRLFFNFVMTVCLPKYSWADIAKKVVRNLLDQPHQLSDGCAGTPLIVKF